MQPQVIEEWLAQIAVLSGTGKIPDELRALARIAGHLTPEDAVDARENVQTVARFHGFPTGARTLDLELRAVLGSAGKAVQGGENVQVIAKLGGIVEAGAVRILEGEAVDVGVGSETPRNWQGHQPT